MLVYLAINKINGKKYVGFTRRTLAYRKCAHFSLARSKRLGTVFTRAIRKHGESSFEFSILEVCNSVQASLDAERRHIALIRPEYNVSAGGIAPSGIKWTKKRREKFSVSAKAAWTQERKAYISKMFSGKRLKPEQVDAMRLMDKSYQFKSIVCLNDSLFFASIRTAAKHYGISAKGIGEMLHGRQSKCGGFSFVYANAPISDRRRESLLSAISERALLALSRRKSRSVICLSDDTVYPSGVAAAKIYKICPSRVSQLCKTGKISASGLAFGYTDLLMEAVA